MKFGMNKYGVYAPIEEIQEQKVIPLDKDGQPIMSKHPTPFERRRAAVYATGNKWAIESFEATHN